MTFKSAGTGLLLTLALVSTATIGFVLAFRIGRKAVAMKACSADKQRWEDEGGSAPPATN
jgi:hypothetical protein